MVIPLSLDIGRDNEGTTIISSTLRHRTVKKCNAEKNKTIGNAKIILPRIWKKVTTESLKYYNWEASEAYTKDKMVISTLWK